jgi:bifunctional DNA-binding transcriptional regulator/antitoxin component of YhaV-PrlF toxin-antitoxin module
MKPLVVDTEGKIVIPPEITHKGGFRPGDQIAILETEEGLLVRPEQSEARAWLEDWWNSLTEAEKIGILSKIRGSRKMPGRKIALNLRGLIFLPHFFCSSPVRLRTRRPEFLRRYKN